jgi:TPR repeat protein
LHLGHEVARAAARAMVKSSAVLEKAAAAGDAEAQFALGLHYLLGRGVETNVGKAFELLTLAAEAHVEDADYFKDIAAAELARLEGTERERGEAAVARLLEAKRRELFPKPVLIQTDC